MYKNYYKILEVDSSASPEVIEKAYKALAKKYHPDLQEESQKKSAGEKLKEINEGLSKNRTIESTTPIIEEEIIEEEPLEASVGFGR